LLLDSFFEVVVHWGSTIVEWRRNEYHKNPEYVSFATLLEAPMRQVDTTLANRFPFPHFVETDQHGSQARYLLRFVNPTTTHNSGVQDTRTLANPHASGVQEVIYTDDASLQKFLVSLKQAVAFVEAK